ncbi:hypothetical protein [Commensalibacter nepenthis]|uniref:Uncharacterized protein n=1 Tax=Commensalibacter nepenthis TaxID=3043872 RepID=A0ABT6QAD6_9PROT|nr:hypothetical protein [Commensalibacter sp. TBRC 10068]MDI2113870.1 hypothetical protein [Commensalibacter sp. TBRC 10068]
MEKKTKWGAARIIFFSLKTEIEKDLENAIPQKEIWLKHKDLLNCCYSNFSRLCQKYIGNKINPTTIQNHKTIIKTDERNNVTAEQKPRSKRPAFTGRKINFTPTPNPENVKRWINKTKK